jgi:cyclopropane fatty-acyl-phospholipid synthase-like methyltransferase
MNAELQSSYDEFPYQSFAFSQTHPDRLATIGLLFGVAPTPVDRCKVLEIGCASAGNLIPMAASLPNSQFVGIDLSPVQVKQGVADVTALGLANIRLLCMNVMDFGEDFGAFDYIVAHGVYSWVPNDVQEKILAVCARQLSPGGIAYISYNTLPGWRMRGAVREAMRYHTRQFPDAKTRVTQARAMLDFLAESVQSDNSAYAVMLRSEAERVRKQADYYILHDHLEEVNEPLYFYQFTERATRHGLRYLAEADFTTMLPKDFAPQVAQTLSRIAPDVLKREQFMDFLRNRAFRQTLLVREAVTLNRKLSPVQVMPLRIASEAQPVRDPPDLLSDQVEEFRAPNGSGVTTQCRITKAAMLILAENSPLAVPFDELLAMARARLDAHGEDDSNDRGLLATDMLRCFAAGAVEVHWSPSRFVIEVSERPEASAVARLQAKRGSVATNLRHESGNLDEDARRVLPLLDGSRTLREIAAIAWPGQPPGEAADKLKQQLSGLARLALLVR